MSKPFYMGRGLRRTRQDVVAACKAFQLPEHLVEAVMQVEARNSGVTSSGAVVALYEPHIAYRYTREGTRKKLQRAGLAYKSWQRKYPKTSYPRIDKCSELVGEEIAAISTSWGLGQVMGFNHKRAGYPSAVSMVRSFADGELPQLWAMLRFIATDPAMYKALWTEDWRTFARKYNGPGYAKHNYHGRLAKAAARWKRKLGADAYVPAARPEKPPLPPLRTASTIVAPKPGPATPAEKAGTGLMAALTGLAGGFAVAWQNGLWMLVSVAAAVVLAVLMYRIFTKGK